MHSILHLSKYYLPNLGGIESAVKSITESNNPNFEHTVLTNSKNTEIRLINNVRVIDRKSFSVFSQPISLSYCLWYLLNRKKFSIIHLHLPNYVSALLVLLFPPKKLIVHWHASIDNVHENVFLIGLKFLESKILMLSNSIIIGTKTYANGTKILSKFNNKTEFIPYGCDSSYIEETKKENLLISVGRLVPYKGYLELIKHIEIPNHWRWIIVGNGPLLSEIKKIIDVNGLDKKIQIYNDLNDKQVKEMLSKSKIFLFPSITRQESFGISQIEAISAGCVPINFDIPGSGVGELIKNNIYGYSIEHKNYLKFNNAIDKLIKNKDLLNEFSNEAIKNYNRFFTKASFTDSVFMVYKKII
jgi:glycosyltransferase involved in cell wall biosynthesis